MGIGIILDIIFAGILILMAFISARRGFVRAGIETVGWILIILLVFSFSIPLSQAFYENVIKGPMEAKVEDYVDTALQSKTGALGDDIWASLPPFLIAGAGLAGITQESLNGLIGGSIESSKAAITTSIMSGIIAPALTFIVRAAISLFAIVFGMFIIRLIAKCINGAVDMTPVSGVNRTLGAVMGVIKGIIFIFVVCAALMLVSVFIMPKNETMKDLLASSFIYDFFRRLVMPLF